ncbi:uncharacterized protein PITG_08929 [Phytophthora infestans T30-4]|uniref:Uncharacterized protein n=1 Tax=Phytophthora infestans (strain T30-4) TaxID=403677 RepID=D0NDI7_PHYIT|nr:uncharacterized protein PITG_08929 [Phytophthora infestans T30-4]EEY56144.1 conserved hypothetical protein [Phytophthora infestans T30-4]|eukprot:XP_002902974.1 conserved hypothetical protein [Phytophthora infestans T30-4]
MVNCKGVVRPPKSPVNQEICRYCRTTGSSKKNTEMEQSTVDFRRRRHTSSIAPSRPSRARQLLLANATELQAARRHQNATELHTSTSMSCDFTQTTGRMVIRDATLTESRDRELATTTGSKPTLDVSDESTEMRLSTVDLRLPKYKVDVPVPTSTKRGRRVSAAGPSNSALTPISIEHLAAIDAKLSSVELELKRYDAHPKEQPKQPKTVTKRSKKTEKFSEPIDFHLSTVDLRPHRHTTVNTASTTQKISRHRNGGSKVDEVELRGLESSRRKKDVEPIDFHLSTFNLKPRRHEDRRTESRGKKEKKEKKKEETIPKYSKDEPCDLAYLSNFRSYTV